MSSNVKRKNPETALWYPVSVSHGSVQELKKYLDTHGIICYAPYSREKRDEESGFRSLCFIRTTMAGLNGIMAALCSDMSINCLWDGTSASPAKVGDKTMNDFMSICESADDDIVRLRTVSSRLSEGVPVRIIAGKFAGIEGRLIRFRKTRRVMVELPGKIAVATEYIRPEQIEQID